MLTLRRWYTRCWLWYEDHRGVWFRFEDSALRSWQ
jgi:hypothetical protein